MTSHRYRWTTLFGREYVWVQVKQTGQWRLAQAVRRDGAVGLALGDQLWPLP